MQNLVRSVWTPALAGLLFIATSSAQRADTGAEESVIRVVNEDFSSDPRSRGWEVFGTGELMQWNAAGQRLDVTWDSSQPNSYLRLPLGTVLTRRDDFSVALDLKLNDIAAGVRPEFPGAFQIAFGFQNHADASKPGFFRGAGDRSPNLVEFNFFPDTGFGPTVWPVISATNSTLNYTGAGDFSLFNLPLDVTMRVTLRYAASNETATLTITTNGVAVGPLTDAPLAATFTAFAVDTLAISSYSEAGQGPFMPGSVLAHGTVDNLVAMVPQPAIRAATGTFENGRWRHSLRSQSGWNYTLESTADFKIWTAASAAVAGTGGLLTLENKAGGVDRQRFFRVRATRTN